MFGASLEFLPIRKQQDGIEIALHGATMFQVAPADVERDAPIEADHFGSGFIHSGQKRGTVGAEINDGRAGLLQTPDEAGYMRQDVAAVVFHT